MADLGQMREDPVAYLRRYQAWRRGEDPRGLSEAGLDALVIGAALDQVLEALTPGSDRPSYRFGLYAGAEKLGLCNEPEQPVALFADEAMALAHGRRLYGEFAEVRPMVAVVDE
ncbi:hypothetical protein SAMN04244572_04351 [Azotobacter beijerinckii]|uniref:Uncharacterized protein n=1 Tax=Azotobacter beijerinckii TaxID=170623 RepID=A0A1H6ZHQ8_9GAMM|nr:hypothetical protein [Azotobacter beijerinckii]SEJ52911.1 hypothetical protein SAMN04244572_04351 [Azotobacter beijerinckii]